jgi:tetratricopeptide (TPR) repeat protein
MRPDTRLAFLLLTAVTLAIYLQVGDHDFINFDDGNYVSRNPHVQQGITPASLKWALTANVVGNWHPLTVLSHMLDCQLFGNRPGLHHLVNVLLHLINAMALFILLRRMTQAAWQSLIVALLFAIHPQHVESVAWIAERKDVLSTFFWLLSLLAYHRYSGQPGIRRYLPVLIFLALGLMAKPMVVTLPCVMLLLDYWPLQRKKPLRALILEKLPMFVLVAASGVMTCLYQDLQPLAHRSLYDRITNALVSYGHYFTQMFWPQNLALHYPYYQIQWWQIVGAAMLLALITVPAIRLRNKYPCIIVGCLWYLGTLFPVIGIITVGAQAMADRYTYIPSIGIFIGATWLIASQVAEKPGLRRIITGLMIAYLLVLTVMAYRQTRLWKNSTTIYRHALSVTPPNFKILNNLGYDLIVKGEYAEAATCLEESIRLHPTDYKPYCNLGRVYVKLNRVDDGIACFEKAASMDSSDAELFFWLGNAYGMQGRFDKVIGCMGKVVQLDPRHLQARNVLGAMLARKGDLDGATQQFEAAVAFDSTNIEAVRNLRKAREELRISNSELRIRSEE